MNVLKKMNDIKLLLFALLLCFAATGCSVDKADTGTAVVLSGDSILVEKEPVRSINDAPFVDNRLLYSHDDNNSVVTMYLTVRRGSASENADHSWSEINSYSTYDYAEMGVEKYQVEGILQVGDENGPVAGELGFGLQIPNATVQIRGATTSREPQKSFKIKLKKDSGEWHQQRTIALNKHIFDGLRFRNKLCYDLMKDIPNMVSLRTQFVHLYVKDLTDTAGNPFVDYGLYTQVEQPNNRFLRSHHLDSNGQLYKMKFFEFYRYPDAIKLKTDPGYDIKEFEKYLKIKGNDDHSKLIALLDDLNDYSKPTEEVFEKYFDANNYFTWLAFNILVGNTDTTTRNTYLYSPLNSSKWYFIAWDCDGSLIQYEYRLQNLVDGIGYEYGISNYWGDVIFNRVIRLPKYQAILEEKIEALRKFITPERVRTMAQAYQAVVKKYVFSMPDIMHSRLTDKQYDDMVHTFAKELDDNYALYKLSLKTPMPFYLDVPSAKNKRLSFKWNPAFDLNGQDITYTFELASDCDMKNNIIRADKLSFPSFTTDMLTTPGKYFWRVCATNESGFSQYAMSYYVNENTKHFGVQCFYVQNDLSIVEEETHE